MNYFQTVRFKSYLSSLGIPDPVTRETHGTGDKYFRELAKQISSFMETPLKVFTDNYICKKTMYYSEILFSNLFKSKLYAVYYKSVR